MTEDFVVVSAVSKEKGSSIENLDADISTGNCTKNFQRSPSRRERFQVMIDCDFLKNTIFEVSHFYSFRLEQ